jgi:hypothetical protein
MNIKRRIHLNTNKLISTIILLLLSISCNTYGDLEAPAIFATKQATPPCYIKMSPIPGFTFTINQQIPPIYVHSYVQPLIGSCSLLITVSGLPSGLRIENPSTNPVILGTPTTAGFFLIMVTAQARNNAAGATFPMTIKTEK